MFQSIFHDAATDGEAPSPIVSLGHLQSLRPELLARLLEPYRVELQAHGLSLEHDVLDQSSVRQLHRTVNSVDGAVPWRLQQALLCMGDLTTPRGHARLLKRVLPALGASSSSMAPEGLAALSYLDHRAIFDAAHQAYERDTTGRPYPFVEFVGKSATPPALDGGDAPHARWQRHAKQWFGLRECGRDVHCRIVETAQQVRFYVTRTGPCDSPRSVASSWAEPDSADIVKQYNLVVFHRQTGHLAIDARSNWQQNYFRSLLGQEFWNDAQHFQLQPLYTTEPLRCRGRQAFDPQGLPWVRQAKLIFAQSQAAPSLEPQLDMLTGQVADDAALWARLRHAWKIQAFGLRLDLQPLRQSVFVVVCPPHQLGLDRWRCGDVVRDYLRRLGFVQGARRAQEAA